MPSTDLDARSAPHHSRTASSTTGISTLQPRQRPGGACEECRRRKLRCDGQQPQCGMCIATGAVCQVTTNRAPRGPKRGYLKAMQARIAALEDALCNQQSSSSSGDELITPTVEEDWAQGFFQTATSSAPSVHDGSSSSNHHHHQQSNHHHSDAHIMSWDFPISAVTGVGANAAAAAATMSHDTDMMLHDADLLQDADFLHAAASSLGCCPPSMMGDGLAHAHTGSCSTKSSACPSSRATRHGSNSPARGGLSSGISTTSGEDFGAMAGGMGCGDGMNGGGGGGSMGGMGWGKEVDPAMRAVEGPNGMCTTNISAMMQAELDQLYFDRIHTFTPIVHHGRYSSWARQPIKTKAQLALQYTLWTSAASASAHYQDVGGSLYHEALRLVEELEEEKKHTVIRSLNRPPPSHNGVSTPGGAAVVTIEHIQAWLLLAIHEFMFVDFQRGWLSAVRAFRLIQLDWFRDVDGLTGAGAEGGRWLEMEQKRRTFWMAYCLDRFVSLRSGSPLTFDEQSVIRLPAPESNFQNDRPIQMGYLAEAISNDCSTSSSSSSSSSKNTPSKSNKKNPPQTSSPTSSFTECIVVATLAGRILSYENLAHTNRAMARDMRYRHQYIDAVLTQRMEAFSLKFNGAMQQEADPMLMFIGLMWRTTVLFFSKTMERVMMMMGGNDGKDHSGERFRGGDSGEEEEGDAEEMMVMMGEYGRRFACAAQDVLCLTTKLAQANWFKVHPLTPIPLSLCAELLASNHSIDNAAEEKVAVVKDLMNNLRSFNNLGKGLYSYAW